jgi:excisionase family DNA binding protein
MTELLTTKDAAEELDISPQMVRRHCDNGNIDAQRLGIGWVITREALEAFKENRRPPGRPRKYEER